MKIKKNLRGLWTLALAGILAVSSVFVSKPAGEAEARYNYTVRIYAGQQGTISGGEYVEYAGLNYDDRVNFNLRDVQLKDDSKYYVKGIRLAGRDNNTIGNTSFLVEGEADYVIAYGLLSEAVQYTIEYVDTAGNELAPSEHYYGNVGDKPVIAFLYIEGYRPNAYNLTRTLQADASKNIFRFVYTRVDNGSSEAPGGPSDVDDEDGPGTNPGTATRPSTTPTERPNVNPGGIPVVPAQQGGNGAGGQGAGGQDADDGNADDNDEGEEIGENDVPLSDTDEVVDLDDPEVPLASALRIMNEAKLLGVPVWMELLCLALLIAAGAYGYKRYKDRRDQ